MKYSNSFSYLVHSPFALFSDPVTRIGGEKSSYMVPTYQALVGIAESCYWKPTFKWIIDSVRVMNPIRTQSKGIRPIKYSGGNDLSIYTYLSDVAYQVKMHFEWNETRPDLAADRSEDKHYQIARRSIERGGRRDIFLGTRECQGYVEPCVYGEGVGAYDETPEISFGVMIHGLSYPGDTGQNTLEVRLWSPKMLKGEIHFCRPEDCPVKRNIRSMHAEQFIPGTNFSQEEVAL